MTYETLMPHIGYCDEKKDLERLTRAMTIAQKFLTYCFDGNIMPFRELLKQWAEDNNCDDDLDLIFNVVEGAFFQFFLFKMREEE